ncbi:MAG TPA: glycosyltransferase [Pseudonocardia sp.]|nr:glycosyltransferase [Pseudonocardia sp.]
MTIEVLLPTCARPVELATTLAGLAAQEHPFDVLVSDQSPGPASFDTEPARTMARVLRSQGRQVRMVRHLPRRGITEHRAFLLASSTADRVLFLDDDVWLAPGTVARLHDAIDRLGCGMVGCAMQGLSYLDDERPDELVAFERWPGRPEPERLEPGTPQWERWRLHNAANPAHLARRHVRPGEAWVAYKVAWIAGCVLYDRAELVAAGGFDFWREVPENAVGEDVVAQQRVMERAGGAGILPSGAVHLESATTMPDRPVTADAVLRAVVATG